MNKTLSLHEYISQRMINELSVSSINTTNISTESSEEYAKLLNFINRCKTDYSAYLERKNSDKLKHDSLIEERNKCYKKAIPVFIREVLAFFTTVPFTLITFPIVYILAAMESTLLRNECRQFYKNVFFKPFIDGSTVGGELTSASIRLSVSSPCNYPVRNEIFDSIASFITLLPVFLLLVPTVFLDVITYPFLIICGLPSFIINGRWKQTNILYFTQKEIDILNNKE